MSATGAGHDADFVVARWAELEEEMALLCRGLEWAWSNRLGAVTTVVSLPDGAEYEGPLTLLCRRQATAHGLLCALTRATDGWEVHFSRPPVEGRRSDALSWLAAARAFPAHLARLYRAAQRLQRAPLGH